MNEFTTGVITGIGGTLAVGAFIFFPEESTTAVLAALKTLHAAGLIYSLSQEDLPPALREMYTKQLQEVFNASGSETRSVEA